MLLFQYGTYPRWIWRALLITSILTTIACSSNVQPMATSKASTVGKPEQSQSLQRDKTATSTSPIPLISRNIPAYASSGTASNANDANFDSSWQSDNAPVWLAYDLSSVPVSERGKVLLVWYNESFNYDHTVIRDVAYDMPGSYTINLNFAPGGTSSPPTSRWQTVITVIDNHYHSRQHVFDMHRANWVRLNVTAIDGTAENYYVSINMDIYDASHGLHDDFIDFGDSITAGTMGHSTINNMPSFADLIHSQIPTRFPIQEDGGIGYLTSSTPIDPQHHYLQTWLSMFPGNYVGLSYGTNDSYGCSSPANIANTVYKNYTLMVKTTLAAGKIPIIPHMIWSPRTDLQTCAAAINAKLDQLYKAYPQIIPGPDLYAVFRNHPGDFDDGIHPNDQGAILYRQAWVNTFLLSIYHWRGIGS